MNKNLIIKLTAFFAAFMVLGAASFVLIGANYGTAALGSSGISESDSGIYITIVKPSGWRTKEAQVNIELENTQNRNIKSIRVKNGEKGTWTDVTQDPHINISENSTVYVEVEDRSGYVVSKSRYIDVFDREKPTVKATVAGRLLKVSATDTISGVKAIYINGELYDDLTNDTVSVTINKNLGSDISIQAEDNAGNMSQVYTTKNPLDQSNAANTRAVAPSEEDALTTTPATTSIQSTAGQASTTEVKKDGTAETTDSSSSGAASTDDKNTSSGSASSNDEIIVGTFEDTNKQFMSVVTKEGQTFYLIVDHDKDSENVYFLTEITLSDLNTVAAPNNSTDLASANNSSGAVNPEDGSIDAIDGGMSPDEIELILDGENDSNNDTGGGSSTDNGKKTDEDSTDGGNSEQLEENQENSKEEKKKSPIPGWIVIFILIAGLGFAGYMYFVFLPKKRAQEAFVDEEDNDEHYTDNYLEDDYEDFTDIDDLDGDVEEVIIEDSEQDNAPTNEDM